MSDPKVLCWHQSNPTNLRTWVDTREPAKPSNKTNELVGSHINKPSTSFYTWPITLLLFGSICLGLSGENSMEFVLSRLYENSNSQVKDHSAFADESPGRHSPYITKNTCQEHQGGCPCMAVKQHMKNLPRTHARSSLFQCRSVIQHTDISYTTYRHWEEPPVIHTAWCGGT